jgi:hypothetical protein
MVISEMDHAESAAQHLLEAALIGSHMEYRDDQSRGQYDFDLHNSDGSVTALEVTSSVDQLIERTYARIRKGGPMVKTKLCKKDWLIHPALGADPRQIRAEVDYYLAEIELEGIDQFWGPTNWHSPGVERIYNDLAVVSGSVFPHWKEPGQIGISLPSGVGAFKRADAAIEAGENEALKHDNRRKLGAAGTNKRHLAVYVFPTNYSPWCALVDCAPPAKPANLPSEITDLWLFTETRSSSEYVLWHANATLEWSCRRIALQASPSLESCH